MEACNRHEKQCDELVKHTFPGGKNSKSKSIFDRIEELYNDLNKKPKTYILYNKNNPFVANEDDVEKIETKDKENKLQTVSEHVPVSVSIFSNVPEYDNKPILFVK